MDADQLALLPGRGDLDELRGQSEVRAQSLVLLVEVAVLRRQQVESVGTTVHEEEDRSPVRPGPACGRSRQV